MTTETDETYVCYRCIGDPFLREEVNAEGARKACDYCGKKRAGILLSDLADRVHETMERYYVLTPDTPGTEGGMIDPEMGWERRGEPVLHVIAEIANIDEKIASAIVERLSEQHGYDAFEGGYESPYGFEACYEERRADDLDLRDRWAAFRSEIGARARFFSPHARNDLDEIFGDVSTLRTWQRTPAVREIQPGEESHFVYRARVAYSSDEIQKFLKDPARELGPPSSRVARAGRMNASGISVFYGAQDAQTCIAEVRAPVGSHVVVGRFEIVRPVRLLDFDVLTQVVVKGSLFDPEYGARLSRAAFLRRLVREISRPVMPRDEEFEYLPTQVVAEYLAACVSPRLDGIIFHSSQTNGEGRNVVLFNHACVVEPYDLPEGSEISFLMGWETEDDFDDSIAIFETVPDEQEQQEQGGPGSGIDRFADMAHDPFDPAAARPEIFLPTHDPTLRLDVAGVEVLRIRAVTYDPSNRHVMRIRRNKSDKEPF